MDKDDRFITNQRICDCLHSLLNLDHTSISLTNIRGQCCATHSSTARTIEANAFPKLEKWSWQRQTETRAFHISGFPEHSGAKSHKWKFMALPGGAGLGSISLFPVCVCVCECNLSVHEKSSALFAHITSKGSSITSATVFFTSMCQAKCLPWLHPQKPGCATRGNYFNSFRSFVWVGESFFFFCRSAQLPDDDGFRPFSGRPRTQKSQSLDDDDGGAEKV